jgi:hypothetical protein
MFPADKLLVDYRNNENNQGLPSSYIGQTDQLPVEVDSIVAPSRPRMLNAALYHPQSVLNE